MRNLFLIIFLFLILPSLKSQEEEDIPEDIKINMPRMSIRLNAGVPNPTSNQVFQKKFIGIYETNVALHINLSERFFIGLGFKNGLMSITNYIQYGVNTKMQMNTAFVKIGYNHFHTSKIFSTFYINGGYNKSMFTSVICPKGNPPDNHWEAVLIEPGYSINFYAEDNLTLGFYTSFNYLNRTFDPQQVCLQDLTPLSGLSTSKNTTYINIGLEMYIGLGKKKK